MTRFRVAVHIVPRKGILDPQGKAVADALHALEFPEVGDVRVGRHIILDVGAADPADAGFILSLHLQPQQLRIGRMVARAPGDRASSRANVGDTPAIPEIAYVTNGSIVVERYQGRLPAGLAESLK